MERDAAEIRRDIEQTRARLGDTVEALAYKTDVSARANDAVHERVESAKDAVSERVEFAKDAVGDRVESAKQTVADAVDATAATLTSVAHSAHEKIADVLDKVRPHESDRRETRGL